VDANRSQRSESGKMRADDFRVPEAYFASGMISEKKRQRDKWLAAAAK